MEISRKKFMIAIIALVAISYIIGVGIGMEMFFD